MYKAAVIIPTRGGADRLPGLLDALEKQTEKNFQVITVVDGDIDGSAEVIEKYRQRAILNIQAIVFDENKGRSEALNAGHRAAVAEVLIRCDDDLLPAPQYVARHVELHHGAQETGVIGIYLNEFPDTAYARAYGRYRDKKFRDDAYKAQPHDSWHYWAGNCSMTKTMFDKIGGYDPRYRLYGWEDVDMGYQLYTRGAKIIIDPELATTHRVAATTSAIRAKRALHAGAARDIFLQKYGRTSLTDPNPRGIWGGAVKALAFVSTESSVQLYGKIADYLADRIPPKAAEKLIALVVESASYAGIKHPHRATKIF